MGLFDKKYCDICGEKIGLLGNRKLEDGNLCKSCAKKLSPWFSDRRKSTVEEIKEQLAWREENKARVASFHATQSLGNYYHVWIDRQNGTFTVSKSTNLAEENPDILSLSDVTGCNLDVSESHYEIMKEGKDNKRVSYNPPRYKYSYDFYCQIYVNNPYYSEMKFRLNPNTLHYEITSGGKVTMGIFTNTAGFNPQYDPNYQEFQKEFEEIRAALTGQGAYGQQSGYAQQGQYAPQSQYGKPNGYAQQGQYGQPGNYGAAGVASQAPYGQQNDYAKQEQNRQAGNYGMPGTVAPAGLAGQDVYGQQGQYDGTGNAGSQNPGACTQTGYRPQPVNGQNNGPQQTGAAAASASWICPGCGSSNTGKFCENCGTPRPV